MWVVVLSLLLLGCGPVLLGEEVAPDDAGTEPRDGDGSQGDGSPPTNSGAPDGGAPLAVTVRIRPVECGSCFELQAQGTGGKPPYELEWEDGSNSEMRSVCVDGAETTLSVVAVDAAGARSASQTVELEAGDAGCPEATQPDAGPAAMICLQNLSLEGALSANPGGQASTFDAPPWSTCTNPLLPNTPDVGNETVAVTSGVPAPSDGLTYVALGEGEQISQALCAELPLGTPVHLALDLARIDIDGVPPTEQVFLEIWGGLAVDCSQYERLWASPALVAGWQTFCVTLQPTSFTTQVTLRANADQTSLSPAYLLVDNLQQVDGCP